MKLPDFQIEDVVEITRAAGRAALTHYKHSDLKITVKEDKTPLTQADQASHDVLVAELSKLTPDVPVISEEGAAVNGLPELCWLVDPLDGTREFIKQNGEFSVLVSLMQKCVPIAAVIDVPVKEALYYAMKNQGAFRITGGGKPESIKTASLENERVISVCISRSHSDEKTKAILAQLPEHKIVQYGSAWKFGLLADGTADVYLRLGGTNEWDTAAGQLILEEAGGAVIDLTTKDNMKYGKAGLRNNEFIALGDRLAKNVFLALTESY